MALACKYCKKDDFKNENELQDHIDKTHICMECNEEYTNRIELLAHYQEEHNLRPTWCAQCDAFFLTWDKYKIHMKEMHNNNNVKIRKCKYKDCNYIANTLQELKSHYEHKHEDPRAPIYCKYAKNGCKYFTKQMSSYKRHLKTAHGEGEYIECPYCDEYTTKRRDNLIRHIRTTHKKPDILKMFVCPYDNPKEYVKYKDVIENGDVKKVKKKCPFKGLCFDELYEHIKEKHPELVVNFDIHKKKTYIT